MGESDHWSPWRHLREYYPHVRVHETELPGDLLGCLDHDRAIIWLDSRLTCGEKRATIGHECGHLALDTQVNGLWVPAPEWKVNRWAARHLIAMPALLQAMKWTRLIPEIAEELFVDEKTVRDRFRHLTDPEQDAVMAGVEQMRAA